MKKFVICIVTALALAGQVGHAQNHHSGLIKESVETNYDNNKNPRQTVANLFDGNLNSKWFAESFDKTSFPVTITWAYDEAPVVTGYKLTSANDMPRRDPKSWTLYGSKNGKKYVKLDARDNETWTEEERKTTHEFTLSKEAKGYRFFKLEITKLAGNDKPQLAEIELVAE